MKAVQAAAGVKADGLAAQDARKAEGGGVERHLVLVDGMHLGLLRGRTSPAANTIDRLTRCLFAPARPEFHLLPARASGGYELRQPPVNRLLEQLPCSDAPWSAAQPSAVPK